MARRRGSAGEFLRNFSDAYNLGTRLATDIGLRRAGQIDQQEVSAYTPNQGQELEAAANARDADGKPLYEVKANDGGTYAVTPTAGGETATIAPAKRYRLGATEQDTPFRQEQVQAERLRRMGDVYASNGFVDKSANLYGLAKTRDDEANKAITNERISAGLAKAGPDLSDAKRMFKIQEIRLQTALDRGDFDEVEKAHRELIPARDALMKDYAGRALRVWEATGNPVGFSDVFRLAQTGNDVAEIKPNGDGTFTYRLDDNSPVREVKTREHALRLLSAISDPQTVMKAELDRFDRLRAAKDKLEIEENAPSKLAETRYRNAAADAHTANAEYTRGARTAQAEAAAAARRQGGGSGIARERWDAQQAAAFKKDMAPMISFADTVSLDGDQLVHSLMSAGYSPDFIRDNVYRLRSENPNPESFDAAARSVIANLKQGVQRPPGPSSALPADPPAKRAVAAQKTAGVTATDMRPGLARVADGIGSSIKGAADAIVGEVRDIQERRRQEQEYREVLRNKGLY